MPPKLNPRARVLCDTPTAGSGMRVITVAGANLTLGLSKEACANRAQGDTRWYFT